MISDKKKNIEVYVGSELALRKHVGMIHSENKLNLMQRKICNIMLFNALDSINEKETHQIELKKLCSLIGYNSNATKLVKNAIKKLISTVMEWNLLEDKVTLDEEMSSKDEMEWNASSLLAGASIKNGIISYSYSPQLRTILSTFHIYGRINLFVQAKFESAYSLVLYENCVRYKNTGKTTIISLDVFRALMGVPEGKYTDFKDLKRRVINTAINEINSKSDIYVEEKLFRSERKVISLQFLISTNENYKPKFRKPTKLIKKNDEPHNEAAVLNLLCDDFNVSSHLANSFIKKYGSQYILDKINFVRTKKNIENPGAYLIAAIKNDYKIESVKNNSHKDAEADYEVTRKQAQEASEIASLKKEYMKYKWQSYIKLLNSQEREVERKIYKEFSEHVKPNFELYKRYKQSGLQSPFVMSTFIDFIDKNYSYFVNMVMDFEEFIVSDEIDVN